ncbi:MAG: YchJ family protein [Rickettsiales bacterium]
MEYCPCGSGKSYDHCCNLYISGRQIPLTPEALMRSRYTAFTKANIDYIERTMKAPALNDFNQLDALAFAKDNQWIKLEVVRSSQQKSQGIVEFIAHFTRDGEHHVLHEISEFHLDDGQWFYIDGTTPGQQKPYVASEKIGRNDPCLCGSGKKHKKCCG